MSFLRKLFQFSSWFLFLFFFTSTFALPTLGRIKKIIQHQQGSTKNLIFKSSLRKDLKILHYPQTLDHFNYQPESYLTFQQKYMTYSKYWGGAKANSPILVYLGDEEPLRDDEIDDSILPDYAAKLGALVVLIEHRFYGESKPFGIMSMEEILKNASVRGYFNSAQAIADYAEVILHLKQRLKAQYSPVIVVGGSYGGMLASWFRLKYPHVALGALASSAPVLYFDHMISSNHGYYFVVTKDFKEASKSCYKTIKKSWDEIDDIGSKPNGLSYLSKKFKTCHHLRDTEMLKSFLDNIYTAVSQYGGLTTNASTICNAIDKGSNGSDIIGRIYAGILAYFDGSQMTHNCLDTNYFDKISGETGTGYDWQGDLQSGGVNSSFKRFSISQLEFHLIGRTCSEMVMPVVRGTSKGSMFQPESFNLRKFMQSCKKHYNVTPRPHWITSYYGGHDMQLILERFGSNIIFSNGLKDPYSSAGVLQNLSDSIIAVFTTKGSHCMDIFSANKDDPQWLVNQRKRELQIISGWIKTYYEDLKKYLK